MQISLHFVQEENCGLTTAVQIKAAHVFGFRGTEHAENADERKSNSQHDIKIIRVEESGDLDFVVYGYMNCGDHEGYTGVSVYHYSAERNVSEEQVFIPSTMSYDFLKDDVEKLSYVNQDDQLYLLLENSLFHVDIQGKRMTRYWKTFHRTVWSCLNLRLLQHGWTRCRNMLLQVLR